MAVRGLDVHLGHGTGRAQVLTTVDLTIRSGTTVGLVGESGSGKSTLARSLVGQVRPTAGSILFDGVDISGLRGRALWQVRRRIQMIPQDPYSSLNPRRTVGEAIAEAIDPAGGSVRDHADLVHHWLAQVSLDPEAAGRYPHEFSGGQRQRIAIARALAVDPELVIADEITSALDLTTQAEILNLLARLRRELGLTMVFISHNLAVVRHVSDEVVVLYHGDVVEAGPVDSIFEAPGHGYTRRLLDSVPGGPGFRLETA